MSDTAKLHADGMTLQPNTSQRDLVRLSVLLCGERAGAKGSALKTK